MAVNGTRQGSDSSEMRGGGSGWRGGPPESGLTDTESVKPPVEENPPRLCELIVGLGKVEVRGVEDERARPLALHKRTRARPTGEPPQARTRDMARR